MNFMVGSENQAKLKAVQQVTEQHLDDCRIEACKVPSGVSAQPVGDEETMQGAVNRAKAAGALREGTYGVGLEGGVRTINGTMYLCNWGALAVPDGEIFTAGGAQIPLPEELAEEIRNGRELGDAVDQFFKKQNIRLSEGAMGMLTAHAVRRDELFEHIMQLLIGQFLYSRQSS